MMKRKQKFAAVFAAAVMSCNAVILPIPSNVYALAFDSETVSDAIADEFSASGEEIPNRRKPAVSEDMSRQVLETACNSDYGYQDLVANVQSEAMILLYKAIDEAEKIFFESTDDLEADAPYLRIANDGELTDDQILQTYTLYRDDHPLYYWMESAIQITDSDIRLQCADAYLQADAREAAYQKIVSAVQTYADYCNGSTSNFTYAAATLYLMAQQIDYAYDANGEPEEALWAHSIIGVFDADFHEAVCEGYAKAYQLLMNYFGIPNVYAVGNASGNTGEGDEIVMHAWNIVQMDDGCYYFVDPTWSDVDMRFQAEPYGVGDGYTRTACDDRKMIADYPYRTRYRYFLKGSDFYENHMPLTPYNEGELYQYELPVTSETAYEPSDIGERCVEELTGNYIIFPISSDLYIQTEDAYYAVVQNDGLHRAVEWEGNNANGLGLDEYVIPSEITYEGITYEVVGANLGGCDWDIRSLVVSEGIRYLHGDLAPYDTSYVESLSIPSTVEHISLPGIAMMTPLKNIEVSKDNPYLTSVDGVLYNKDMSVLIRYPNASEITDFTVPDTVDHIYICAFAWNQTLESITFNGHETMIDPYAFREMQALSEITVPETVSLLPRQVFCDNLSLSYINISANTEFNLETFSGCSAEIRIEEGNPYGSTYDGALYIGSELVHYPSGREADLVTVREGTMNIASGAFTDTEHIGKVVIPA